MGIDTQSQPEMAEILRAVIGLRHRTQGCDVYEFGDIGASGLIQKTIEVACFQNLPFGKSEAGRLRCLTQGIQLLLRGLFVVAIEQRHLLGGQRLPRRDIGQHHELFDQAVGIQPVAELTDVT